jgi:tetratricopeptide (TPR) repeat protein
MQFNAELQKGLEFIETNKFESAISIAKSMQNTFPTKYEGYHLAAIACQYLQDWKQSIAFLTQAINLNNSDAELFNLRGFAYLSLLDLTKAEVDFLVAIKIADHAAAHRNLGLLLILRGDIAEGLNYLLDRIKDEPSDPLNWVIVGDLLTGEGMHDKAQSYYKRALSLQSTNSPISVEKEKILSE